MSVTKIERSQSTVKGRRKTCSFSLRAFLLPVCTAVLAIALLLLLLKSAFPEKYAEQVQSAAERFSLDKAEVYAVIKAESGFDPNAESRAGAKGLMQLMPSTARFCADVIGEKFDDNDIFDPEVNIRLGCYYLSYLKQRFDGDYVYAAYNAGEGKVRLWLNENIDGFPIKETADYVKRVKLYKSLYSFLYK